MRKLLLAGLVVLVALGWQYATVSLNYAGNWTALFCTGDIHPLPPQLSFEEIYVFPDSYGFDGQFYHFIAHEPLPAELYPYVEAPGLRYRRILLPLAAWAMSLGRPEWIDFSYLTIGFAFVFLGVAWTAARAEELGYSPLWGLAFAATPATLIFVDRLTVDHALAALVAAFAIESARRASWRLYAILALAPLAREVGLLLTIAWCGACLIRKQWKPAAVFATSALPWLAWTAWVSARMEAGHYDTPLIPLAGILRQLWRPVAYGAELPLSGVVTALDILALVGILMAVGLAVALCAGQPREPATIAAALFAVLAVVLQRDDVWVTVYNYGRIFTPLLILVLLGWLPRNRWLAALPVALILPRLVVQYGPQAQGIVRSLAGG